MITRRYIPIVLGLLMLVTVAFLFLSKSFHWSYIKEASSLEPTELLLTEPSDEKHITLKIHMSVSDEQFSKLQRLNEEASLHYPYIHAELTNIPLQSVQSQQWMELTALGKLGDIQLLPNEWILPFAVQGLLQPVDRNMNSEALADQFVSLTDALKWNGYLWAVPYYSNPYIVLTHQQMLGEEASTSAESGESGEEAEEASSDSATKELQEIAMYKQRLEQYVQRLAVDDIPYFFNVDMDSVVPFWVWLQSWSNTEDEMLTASASLTDSQLNMLHELIVQQQLILTDSLLTVSSSELNESIAAYAVIPFESVVGQIDLLEQHYSLDTLEIPYPWLNGSSFVISSQSKSGADAIKWIEQITELSAVEDSLKDVLAIRPSTFNAYGNSLKYQVKERLMQKLDEAKLMPAAPEWALHIEQWNEQWMSEVELGEKLKRMLAFE